MIRRWVVLLLAAAFLVHLGYLYFQVGRGIEERAGGVSIFYGRPTEMRAGDHLGNLRFAERLQRLSYRKVAGKPSSAGTYAEEQGHIRIFIRGKKTKKPAEVDGPVDIRVRQGRIAALISPRGKELTSIRLEPEELDRVTLTQRDSRHQVTLAVISRHLQNAVIAVEDGRFYSHSGIDLLAIGRALFVNLKEWRFVQGGSTITQQLAKNFFLSPQKTFGRKLQEMELALVLEMRYSKKQLLEMYLNRIYLGQDGHQGIYGVEDAAGFYFAKHAKNLSLAEAALLAGIIHAPNRYFSGRRPEAAIQRRNFVLAQMLKRELISPDQFRAAANAPVQIRHGRSSVHRNSYFIDYIQRITREELGTEKLYHSDYRHYTTLDPLQQAIAEEAVIQGIGAIEKMSRPAGEPLQAALVAVDPRTGELTAMVGGRSYKESRFNRAADARRQPGSAFKPFVLLAALALSMQKKGDKTLSTIVSGEPVAIPTPEGMWTPANFENKIYDKITIRQTIEDSVNTATVRLAVDIGMNEVLATARLAGITSHLLPVPSLALGSFEVTPMELAYAYATIASGGISFEPFPLFFVTMADGETVITRKIRHKWVFDPQVTYLTGYALEGVLERGTAKEAKKLGIYFPAAGKTGTTNGNRDSWFVGFTPEVVCAVWVGYDSGADTGLTGAAGALRIWTRFMSALYAHAGPPAVIPPPGIVTALIDPATGFLATELCPQKLQEAYLAGTAPQETCPEHRVHPIRDNIRDKLRSVGDFFRSLFK